MSLAALFEDFPLSVLNVRPRRSRTLANFLNYLDSEMDQKVDQVFHRLPTTLLELEDSYQNNSNGRKRKLGRTSNAMSHYEPKTKVQVLTNDKFQVILDTSNYQPDEIVVKVVNDKLAISAKHETKGNDVYEFHEMYRSFDLPEGVDPNTVSSRLNVNGQLTIEAPMVLSKEVVSERLIPIERSKEHVSEIPDKDTEITNTGSE